MGLRVNNNIAALNAYRNLSTTDSQMGKSLEKLSSGFRINRAGDDAAGLVISEKLRSQVNGLKVASRNAQDGISVAQTAEGALTEVHSMLQRMRDLSVQSNNTGANGGATGTAVAASQAEFNALSAEIDRIGSTTKFNGSALFDGVYNGTFQVGAETGAGNTISLDLTNLQSTTTPAPLLVDANGAAAGGYGLSAQNLGLKIDTDPGAGVVIGNADVSAATTVTAIDNAIATVSSTRGAIGAVQNRLEHTIANLSVTVENLSASESRIRDTDMAEEMTKFTRAQILTQAGTAMLAQANSAPQQVLQLLRG